MIGRSLELRLVGERARRETTGLSRRRRFMRRIITRHRRDSEQRDCCPSRTCWGGPHRSIRDSERLIPLYNISQRTKRLDRWFQRRIQYDTVSRLYLRSSHVDIVEMCYSIFSFHTTRCTVTMHGALQPITTAQLIRLPLGTTPCSRIWTTSCSYSLNN
jgi:hypothetical protein